MDIQLTRTNKRLFATTPYHPGFVERAKEIGGRWDPEKRAWGFPVEAEHVVRETLSQCYGYDEECGETVTRQSRSASKSQRTLKTEPVAASQFMLADALSPALLIAMAEPKPATA